MNTFILHPFTHPPLKPSNIEKSVRARSHVLSHSSVEAVSEMIAMMRYKRKRYFAISDSVDQHT